MKPVLLSIALLAAGAVPFVSVAARQAPGNAPPELAFGVIEGTVVQEGTNAPIADVKIAVSFPAPRARALLDAAGRGATGIPAEILVAAAGATGAGGARGPAGPAALSAVTDSAGHFVLQTPDGAVVVRAQKDGFFGPVVNGVGQPILTTTAVVTAKSTTTVRLTLVPGGAVNGRVTDLSGKPLANVPVGAVRRGYRRGVPALELVDGRETDDRGAYRIFNLAPGEYLIATLTTRAAAAGASTTTRDAAVSTFYPSAIDTGTAVPVMVRGGDDQPGLDIQVRTMPTFTISGRVTSTLPAGSEVSALNGTVRSTIAQLSILPHESDVLPDATGGSAAANADGTFAIRGVAPGRYDLMARLPASTGWGPQNAPDRATSPWAFGRVAMDVTTADVDNVSIVVHQGVDVTGRVSVDGTPAPAGLQIQLMPDDTAMAYTAFFGQIGAYQPAIDQRGGFSFPLMPEGHYQFHVEIGAPTPRRGAPPPPATTALPPNAYVLDIQQRGVSIYDAGLDVGAGAVDPIDILVATNGATVEGTAVGADRKPVARATVAIVPDEPRRRNPSLYQTVTSDAEGRFTITRVPPGGYKVFAWDSVKSGAVENAEFLRRVESAGMPVAARAGNTATVEVRVIRAER